MISQMNFKLKKRLSKAVFKLTNYILNALEYISDLFLGIIRGRPKPENLDIKLDLMIQEYHSIKRKQSSLSHRERSKIINTCTKLVAAGMITQEQLDDY